MAKTTKNNMKSKVSVKKEVESKVVTDDIKVEQETNEDILKTLSENEALKKQLEDMQKMIAELQSKNESKTSDEVDEYTDIPLNKPIKVMSLYFGGLNLKTGEGGKVFRFNNFADMQPIIYNDLFQIINYQYRFCKDGYFMILDKDVVKAHALEDTYKKLLNDKQIKSILKYDDETISELFTSTTDNIRETIVSVICQQINNGDNIDKNKVDVISRLHGVDLFAFARGDVETLVNLKANKQ